MNSQGHIVWSHGDDCVETIQKLLRQQMQKHEFNPERKENIRKIFKLALP